MTSTETISFELSQPALQARRNAKWNQYDADVLPAFFADMDFSVAAPIQAAIERIVRDRDYGYALRNGEKPDRLVAGAFAQRMKSRYGWELSPDLVLPLADLVQGTYAPILAFSEPGDGVVLQTPNYPPFRDAIRSTERELLALPMRDDGTRFVFDMSELEKLVNKRTRIFVLCNPQNPTGRVFSRDELLALGQFAIEHDLVVISDEIHSDLVFRSEPVSSCSAIRKIRRGGCFPVTSCWHWANSPSNTISSSYQMRYTPTWYSRGCSTFPLRRSGRKSPPAPLPSTRRPRVSIFPAYAARSWPSAPKTCAIGFTNASRRD